jgi:hypothetical protein
MTPAAAASVTSSLTAIIKHKNRNSSMELGKYIEFVS